jgi:hypothetical protein
VNESQVLIELAEIRSVLAQLEKVMHQIALCLGLKPEA